MFESCRPDSFWLVSRLPGGGGWACEPGPRRRDAEPLVWLSRPAGILGASAHGNAVGSGSS